MTTGGAHHDGTSGAGRIAAVVLAAGSSSRMGTSKPLLPVGGLTAIERVVSSLRAAGAGQVVVVTGHDAEALLPVLRRLQVDPVHNPDYESGMFSSVQAGVAGLRGNADAFFVLPVDVPLVTPRALRLVRDRFERSGKGIIYPVCCGRPGHPPLLSARYVRALLGADRTSNLQVFLSPFAEDEARVDVRDLTVLMDMDTPDDHRIFDRFAGILDRFAAILVGAGRGLQPRLGEGLQRQPGEEPSLTAEEALFILAAAGTPANIVEHCRAVAAVGERLAEAIKPRLPALDVALVQAGCLLHDMARLLPNHALLAQEVLTNLGLPRLGGVVGQHMMIEPARTPGVGEAELVYLADKLVADDELVGLDEREARAFRKMRPGPEAAGGIEARMHDARAISEKVAVMLGRPLEDVLRDSAANSEGASRELSIFLVRHAEPLGPGATRFWGHADPELGVPGEERARRLADTLMERTGGACFDAIYSSDLRRAVRTAEIAANNCGATVQAKRWLREIDVGLWEGLSWEEARRDYPVEHREREGDVVGQPFPEGESFRDLQARVVPRFVRLAEDSLATGHRRVLVVGHKGVNRVILAHFLGLPLEELFSIEQDFCAVTVLRVSTDAAGERRISVAGSSTCYSTAPAISTASMLMHSIRAHHIAKVSLPGQPGDRFEPAGC